jgi:hypothetical protein
MKGFSGSENLNVKHIESLSTLKGIASAYSASTKHVSLPGRFRCRLSIHQHVRITDIDNSSPQGFNM